MDDKQQHNKNVPLKEWMVDNLDLMSFLNSISVRLGHLEGDDEMLCADESCLK